MGKEENHAIRQAIVEEVLAKEAVDVLAVRLEPGEARADFGFEGDTVFFLRPRDEEEFWRVRDPKLRYLFIKDISYDSQGEAQCGDRDPPGRFEIREDVEPAQEGRILEGGSTWGGGKWLVCW